MADNNYFQSAYPSYNLIPPLFNQFQQSPQNLSLNQIQGFTPVKEFIDANSIKWHLVKASNDSTVDIPDPKSLQILDYWNHKFPNIQTNLYVYVVEGIRKPRTETEQPTKVLFQWFSTLWIPSFTPQMITDKEWLRANVYAASFVDTRMSKLNAICKVNNSNNISTDNEELIKVEELNERNTERDRDQNSE